MLQSGPDAKPAPASAEAEAAGRFTGRTGASLRSIVEEMPDAALAGLRDGPPGPRGAALPLAHRPSVEQRLGLASARHRAQAHSLAVATMVFASALLTNAGARLSASRTK